jgi:hypothetical protein
MFAVSLQTIGYPSDIQTHHQRDIKFALVLKRKVVK